MGTTADTAETLGEGHHSSANVTLTPTDFIPNWASPSLDSETGHGLMADGVSHPIQQAIRGHDGATVH